MRFQYRGDTFVLSFRRQFVTPVGAPRRRPLPQRMETTAYLYRVVGKDNEGTTIYEEISHATARAYFRDQPTKEQGRVQALRYLLPYIAEGLRGPTLQAYYSRRRGR